MHDRAGVKRACLGRCGRILTKGSYCRRCDPNRGRRRATPGRRGAAKFRREVLARAGGRCAICGTREGVEAHHVRAIIDGGSPTDPANGVALCRKHHREAEAKLRAARRKRAERRKALTDRVQR